MTNITHLKGKIFTLGSESFESIAIELFRYHAKHNSIYKKYIEGINIQPDMVKNSASIPFLPIELFKKHKITIKNTKSELIFESSGTTGMQPSRHFVADEEIYKRSILETFRLFYGEPKDFIFFALLPSYLERSHSSLVYMVNYLRNLSQCNEGGFYLYDHKTLSENLLNAKHGSRKIFLIGVSFALLDFAESFPTDLSNAVVMETGGMKGRKEELIKEELHQILCRQFNLQAIHSEYSMTELLSQAYSKKSGIFSVPPWMKILIREPNDPFTMCEKGQAGGINIIDFANIYSCPFIATQDLGRITEDGSFEVMGRFDNSDIRGCSLLY